MDLSKAKELVNKLIKVQIILRDIMYDYHFNKFSTEELSSKYSLRVKSIESHLRTGKIYINSYLRYEKSQKYQDYE